MSDNPGVLFHNQLVKSFDIKVIFVNMQMQYNDWNLSF